MLNLGLAYCLFQSPKNLKEELKSLLYGPVSKNAIHKEKIVKNGYMYYKFLQFKVTGHINMYLQMYVLTQQRHTLSSDCMFDFEFLTMGCNQLCYCCISNFQTILLKTRTKYNKQMLK